RGRAPPRTAPARLRPGFPAPPPAEPAPFHAMLQDFDRRILPATPHWNHPGFFAYFAVSSPAVGILAEPLAAALNVNAMLWRTGPAATELEQIAQIGRAHV